MNNSLEYFGYYQLVKELIDEDFLNAMRDNLRKGLKDGRVENDWKDRDEAGVKDRFLAIMRHCYKYDISKDPKHLAAIACNAMIVWWHAIKKYK